MARDPRDAAISRMLYRWHRGIMGSRKQYHAHVELVLKKKSIRPPCPLLKSAVTPDTTTGP